MRVALWAAGAVVVVLAAAQLVLPRIAERVVRERAGRYGMVLSAHVGAFPAIELLWGHAQSATVRAGSLRLSSAQAVDMLWSARGVTDVDLTAAGLRVGPLQLRQVSLRKRRGILHLQATLSEADLQAAMPAGVRLQRLLSHDGRVEVSALGGLFGADTSVQVLLEPREGRLVAQPQGPTLAGLPAVTLFSDPRLRIEGVGVAGPSGRPPNWRLSLRASLRGG